MNGVDFGEYFWRKRRLHGGQCFLQLCQRRGADDGAGDEPARTREAEGQLGWRQAVLVGEFNVGLDGGGDVRLAVTLAESRPLGDAAGGVRVGQVFAGQVAEGEGRIGQQADLQPVSKVRLSRL